MKKTFYVLVSLSILFSLTACSKMYINEDKNDTYTITINSPQGKSVMNVSENGLINRSVFKDNFLEIETTKEYSYDSNNELRSVEVSDNADNSYSITYSSEIDNTDRSAIEDQDKIPGKVRYVQKSHISGSRAASADVSDVEKIEYYYDADGNVAGIMRIDGNGNIYVRDMEQ